VQAVEVRVYQEKWWGELKGRINQCIINNVRYQLGRATTVRESKRIGNGTWDDGQKANENHGAGESHEGAYQSPGRRLNVACQVSVHKLNR